MKMIMGVIGLLVAVCMTVNASVIWSDNFDGLAVGIGDLVVNGNPVFGGASPNVVTGQWAVGGTQFSIVDKGGGDKVLSLNTTGVGSGAAVWLDVSTLGLSPGTYDMQFTIAIHSVLNNCA